MQWNFFIRDTTVHKQGSSILCQIGEQITYELKYWAFSPCNSIQITSLSIVLLLWARARARVRYSTITIVHN